MDGGGGGGGHGHMPGEEKGAERLMDDHLKSIGLHRKKIAKDGSCLFRAVAEQVLQSQSLHTKVRAKCVEFLKCNRESYEAFIEGDFEDYLWKLQDPQQWVGEVEINALAVMYKRDFLIFQEPGKPPVNITDNNFKDKVRLCFLNGNHYDSVYPISHIKNAALCQSILYELLYDGVFNVDRGSLGPCQRTGRASDFLSDDNMAACASSDESDQDAAEPLRVENGTRHNNQSYRGRGRGRPLPERVRRSLNPTLLRNIEFDVWHSSKRAQQKMDFCIAAGMQYTVGDRCQVRLEGSGRSYNATVKEVPTINDNMVTVHIEELGKRHVPLWSLRPPSDDSSWSKVVNKDKRLSNGCGDWERGKGRGRGKPVPLLPPLLTSVLQAAAPGPSGRVQKQHSWPPQATVEEQGGAKPSRKSMSTADSASFGLTKDQRSAKDEEDLNMALLEIQLRDENSFPALGTGGQGDGGRKKGAQRRRSQRNKMSPVEDVRAASPSAGERPKSSTPPATTTAAAAPTAPTNPTLLPAAAAPTAPTNPTLLSAAAAPTPPTNPTLLPAAAAPTAPTNPTLLPAAAAPTAPTNPTLLPAAAAPATKTNAQRSSPTAAAAKPSVTGGALPPSVPCSASVFSFLTPVLPTASSPPSLPALSSPPPISASPPPPSLVPQPTFIAPIALSPGAAQGFHPPSSCLHRTSPSVPSLPHSPSPPTSSLIHHPASRVREAPPAAAQTPNALPDSGGCLTKSQASQNQSHIPVSQTQTPVTHTDAQTPASLPKIQYSIPQHQSLTEVSQNQIQDSVLQPQAQSDMVQIQASHPPPGASYTLTPQASVPVPGSAQPPHPSQLPHPSLCVSASPTHPPLPAQTPDARFQTEGPRPPAHPPSQQPHPAHHPQSIPGSVPLQSLAQLYQDPLYPGFPQGETGDMAQTPSFSSNISGDDLPQDFNILRFFFNLGVKAYSMPLFPPYLYLLPLQHAHTLCPRPPSRSPSPHCPPARHQELYPPTSAMPQYGRQAPLAEPPRPSEPSSFVEQGGYSLAQPPPHRMPCAPLPWQQHQTPPPPTNSNYPVGYPSSAPPYPLPPPSSQGYHPAQSTGHPLYPPTMPQYPLSSLGYQSSSTPDEHHGAMEQLQPPNGDVVPGRGPGPLDGPAAANVANANNNNRAMMLPGVNSFALKNEQGESLTRTVLLVDPPLNNRPILALVSNSSDPISMATMNPCSSPGSPSPYGTVSKTTVPGDNAVYRVHPSHFNPGKTYMSREIRPPAMPTLEALSVGCGMEEDWEEPEGFKPTTLNNPRGAKRPYRGGRGRGGGAYDGGRGGNRRRQGGEGYHYGQYGPAHRGRGW